MCTCPLLVRSRRKGIVLLLLFLRVTISNNMLLLLLLAISRLIIMRRIISSIMALIISLLTLICPLCVLVYGTSSRYTTNNAIVDILIFGIVAISLCIIRTLGLRLRTVSTIDNLASTVVMLSLLVSDAGVLAVNVFRTFLENAATRGGGRNLGRWLGGGSRIRNIWFTEGRGNSVVTLGHSRYGGGRSGSNEHGAAECTKVRVAQRTTA